MKILLATGASGGHIFPALVTAHELKQRGHSVVFGGVLKQAGAKIQLAGFECFEISAQGFSTRSLKTMIVFFGGVIKSLIESWRILNQVKPDSVVGFGGYGAFSLVMVAVLQRIPTMIQEQNVVPGKANRILSLFVKKIAVGFQSAQSRFSAKKVLLTGCPCRVLAQNLDRQSILAEFGLSEEMPILVVLGEVRAVIGLMKNLFIVLISFGQSLTLELSICVVQRMQRSVTLLIKSLQLCIGWLALLIKLTKCMPSRIWLSAARER